MVVEIPRFSQAKFEINREEPLNKLKVPPQWKNTLQSIMNDVQRCFEDVVMDEEMEPEVSPHLVSPHLASPRLHPSTGDGGLHRKVFEHYQTQPLLYTNHHFH